jgi:hypothetical protein
MIHIRETEEVVWPRQDGGSKASVGR